MTAYIRGWMFVFDIIPLRIVKRWVKPYDTP